MEGTKRSTADKPLELTLPPEVVSDADKFLAKETIVSFIKKQIALGVTMENGELRLNTGKTLQDAYSAWVEAKHRAWQGTKK